MPSVRPAESFVSQIGGHLQTVKCLDAGCREIQRCHQLRWDAGDGGIDLAGCDPQAIRRQRQPVEALGVAQQRRITLGTDSRR